MRWNLIGTDSALACAFALALWSVVFSWTDAYLVSATSLLASTCGVLVGFVLTAVSVLISINDRPFIQRIKISGHYKGLLTELGHSSFWLGITFVLSILAIFMPEAARQVPALIASASFFAGVFRFARSFFMFYRVMENL